MRARETPAITLSAAALLLAALPYVAGFGAAPRGMVFLGALNNVGDTGQYLAAIRQGSAGGLLYVDQYSSARVAPVLMYPFYTVTGLVLSPLRPPVMAVYQLLRLLSALALLGALWRFCRVALPSVSPALPFALALCGGGLYAPALLLSGLAPLPFAPAALTAPEFGLFATLLISPHGAAGLAAQLLALTGYLRWRRRGRTRDLWALALGGLLLGLCYPFGIVVLLAVVAVDVAVRIVLFPSPFSRKLRGEFLLALALLPALAVALYYAVLFRRDPLWGGSNMLRLPPPSAAVLIAAFGPLLVVATPALKRLCARPSSVKRDRDRASASGAGPRLVAGWAIVTPLLLLAPLPQTERLLEGWSVALALLGAPTLWRLRRRARVRAVAALSCSTIVLALLYLAIAAHGANPAYYAPEGQMGVARWLGTHAGANDVVMASAGSGNLIVAAAPCHVVVGQNFETFHWAMAQRDALRYYNGATATGERAAILRRQRVTFVVAGPYERALGSFTPGPQGYRLAYRAGPVRVFAVTGGS